MIYCARVLDQNEAVIAEHDFGCPDDQAAVLIASHYLSDEHAIEIWQDNRLVERLDHDDVGRFAPKS